MALKVLDFMIRLVDIGVDEAFEHAQRLSYAYQPCYENSIQYAFMAPYLVNVEGARFPESYEVNHFNAWFYLY